MQKLSGASDFVTTTSITTGTLTEPDKPIVVTVDFEIRYTSGQVVPVYLYNKTSGEYVRDASGNKVNSIKFVLDYIDTGGSGGNEGIGVGDPLGIAARRSGGTISRKTI